MDWTIVSCNIHRTSEIFLYSLDIDNAGYRSFDMLTSNYEVKPPLQDRRSTEPDYCVMKPVINSPPPSRKILFDHQDDRTGSLTIPSSDIPDHSRRLKKNVCIAIGDRHTFHGYSEDNGRIRGPISRRLSLPFKKENMSFKDKRQNDQESLVSRMKLLLILSLMGIFVTTG